MTEFKGFYDKLGSNFDALQTLGEGDKGFMMNTLNKLSHLKPDLRQGKYYTGIVGLQEILDCQSSRGGHVGLSRHWFCKELCFSGCSKKAKYEA